MSHPLCDCAICEQAREPAFYCPVCGRQFPGFTTCQDGCGGTLVTREDAIIVGAALEQLLAEDAPERRQA